MMNVPRMSAISLAEEVVANQARRKTGSVEGEVMARLGADLGKLIGTHGFDVVLARALMLAQRERASLASVRVEPSGTLAGFVADGAESNRDLVAVLSYLFELLMKFIGDELVTRIVHDASSEMAGSSSKEMNGS
ncbi:MAG: hypothetical protein ABI183_02125 [Polyangiaceae bacterium]